MNNMTVDSTVDKLKDFIFDDDKLVTYKWLSHELGVHVNISKQLLWEFWRNNKKKVDMAVTFVIMGKLADGSGRIEVVNETNLSSARDKFMKINCEHVYSIQKTLPDLQMLANAGQAGTHLTAIKCKGCFPKRDQDFIVSQQEMEPPKEKIISLKPSKESIVETEGEKYNPESFNRNVSQTTVSSSEDRNKKKVSRSTILEGNNKKDSEKNSKKSHQSLQTGYHKMFGKVTVSNLKCSPTQIEGIKKKKRVEEDSDSVKSIPSTEIAQQIDERTDILSKEDDDTCEFHEDKKGKNRRTKQKTPSKNNSKIVNDREKNDVMKKRKRILSDSDTTEEDSVSSEYEEEIKDSKISKNSGKLKKSISSPESKNEDDKRIIRKSKDIRFVDHDGFLVTKKVSVSTEITEDVTDEERPSSVLRNETIVNKKQTKQSTLMHFFKKT